MILHLEGGQALTVTPGCPTMGLRVLRVEVTARDTFHPEFLGWFGILLTRFVPPVTEKDVDAAYSRGRDEGHKTGVAVALSGALSTAQLREIAGENPDQP